MGYEINVALNGRHLFATHERSIGYTWELKKVLRIFKEKFPESEGYKISVTKETRYSTEIPIDEALKED